jgi:predicted DCC family thiol-disulfide oxidoreductase YuxK
MARSEGADTDWVLEVENRDRYPFGVAGLDNNINGGAPDGSLVLAAGEAGAGGREFLYTSALMNALGDTDPDLFDLYYGELAGAATLADEIHYLSFTEGKASIREEMLYTMESSIVESGIDRVEFTDLSREYFRLSPVPREWYAGERGSIADMASTGERAGLIESLADHLEANTAGNIVYVDSLTDLVGVREGDVFEWRDIVYLLQGLRRAIKSWGGVVVVYVGQEVLSRHDMETEDFDTFVLVEDGEHSTKSEAALRVVRRLDGPWPLLGPLLYLPRGLRDFGYDIVANNRYRVFGKKDECPLPPPELRERFANRTLE